MRVLPWAWLLAIAPFVSPMYATESPIIPIESCAATPVLTQPQQDEIAKWVAQSVKEFTFMHRVPEYQRDTLEQQLVLLNQTFSKRVCGTAERAGFLPHIVAAAIGAKIAVLLSGARGDLAPFPAGAAGANIGVMALLPITVPMSVIGWLGGGAVGAIKSVQDQYKRHCHHTESAYEEGMKRALTQLAQAVAQQRVSWEVHFAEYAAHISEDPAVQKLVLTLLGQTMLQELDVDTHAPTVHLGDLGIQESDFHSDTREILQKIANTLVSRHGLYEGQLVLLLQQFTLPNVGARADMIFALYLMGMPVSSTPHSLLRGWVQRLEIRHTLRQSVR